MHKILLLFLFLAFSFSVFAQNTPIPTPINWAGLRIFPDVAAKNLLTQKVEKILADSANRVILQKRSKLYFPYLEKILAFQKIHPDFKFLALRESGLQPLFSKDKNAAGFWQVSKQEAETAEMEVNPAIDERKHIFIATHYLANVLEKQQAVLKNPLAVLTAREAGLEEAQKQFGELQGQQNISLTGQSPTIWFDVLAYSLVFRDLDSVSLSQTLVPFRFSKGKKLSEIAEMAGVELFSLQIYNPWIQDKNRAFGKDYAVFIPVPRADLANMKERIGVTDEMEIFVKEGVLLKDWEKTAQLLNPNNEAPILYDSKKKIEETIKKVENTVEKAVETITKPMNTSHSGDSTYIFYTVRPKDGFTSIAQKFRTTVPEIMAWNDLNYQSKIIVGKQIKIKIRDFASELLGIEKPKPEPQVEAKPVLEVPVDQQQTYTLITDENLGQIAQKLSLKAENLATWNGLPDVNVNLKKGTKLQLKQAVEVYQASFGESIEQIAQKMSLDAEKLAIWNKKVPHYAIYGDTENIYLTDKNLKNGSQTPNTNAINEAPKSNNANLTVYYVALAGDNIYTVAKKLNVSVSDLKEWNNIPAGTIELKEGTKIMIKTQ